MIYRQVIPPAPAYLGLNLYLKGSPMLSKSGGGIKKEKSKDLLKIKCERRTSQATKEPPSAAETSAMQAISPRTLVIDIPENLNNSLETDRKLELNSGNGKSLRNRVKMPLTSSRDGTKLIDAVKNIDSARRHASCGPRLMSIVTTMIENSNNDENSTKSKFGPDMKCIGNKFGPENAATDANNNQITSTRASPRKSSSDTPRTTRTLNRPRLKPLNALSKTNTAVNASNRNGCHAISKSSALAPNSIKDYRKYLTHSYLSLNKLPSKLPINEHFFAVGLSLRAWRSKYGRTRGSRDGQIGGGSSRMIAAMPKNDAQKAAKSAQ